MKELTDKLEEIPNNSRLLYLNCGNGEFSLLAALWKKHISVTAYDADEDAIALADHCFSKPDNLTYTSELPDETDFDFIINEKELLA